MLLGPTASIPKLFSSHSSIDKRLGQGVQATRDAAFSRFLSDGVEVLSDKAGSSWTALPAEARLQALERSEQTPFFQRLRSDFVLYFYSNPAIWPLFGYEGPSNDQGYLYRGFNDIDWIKREEI
jgi:hypothetical protein